MDLSIIIVNFNGEPFIENCLHAIWKSATSRSYEVIVIDNHSQDSSVNILHQFGHRLTLICNPENRGFSTANNQGMSLAKGRYLFFLNNDTVLEPDTLEVMLNFYDANPEIGALGPQLLNKDGTPQYTGSILGHWKYMTKNPRKVDFISGAALLTTRALMQTLGGWDKAFFFYNEDLDLCKRILKHGRKIVYLPQARLIHLGGAATKTRKPEAAAEGIRGGLYFVKKHYPPLIYWLYRGIVRLYTAIRFKGSLALVIALLISTPILAAIYKIPPDILAEIHYNEQQVALYPESAESHFELAMSYAYAGKIEQGWEQLKKVPDYDKHYADKVVGKYTALRLREPMEWRHKFKLAFGYYFQEKKKDAEDEFLAILKDHPDHIWAMGFVALLKGEQGHYDEVIAWCKKALQLEPNATAVHFLLGQAYLKKGNYLGLMGETLTVLRLKTEEARAAKNQDAP